MLKLKKVLGPLRTGAHRLRLARVELATARRDLFVSLSVTPAWFGLSRSYREFRLTACGVQVHYRETAWRR